MSGGRLIKTLCAVIVAVLYVAGLWNAPILTGRAVGRLSAQTLPAGAERGQVKEVDFVRDIQPIFKSACYACHATGKPAGRLRLDSKALALEGGVSGKVILPGNSKDSRLLHRILGLGGEPRMPPQGQPLSQRQIALISAWIDQGAVWPEEAAGKQVTLARHWAYVKPVRPALPRVPRESDTAWVLNPIDAFILARLEKEGLHPSAPAPEADRTQLLRRLYLDLTGLPPSPEQVDHFLRDASPKAYEKVVDALLAAPQFGERWAAPWLDLARYADSHGFQKDNLHELWAYRDWVIRALNADMPFDRFTIEQIAGDLLPDASPEQRIATGFHRAVPNNVENGTDQEENRVNQVVDRVNTTATVWLGTTLGCAQCHNHKYDPFTQKEYYQFFAFFNNTARETDFTDAKAMAALKFIGPYLTLADPETQQRRSGLEAELKRLEEEIAGRSNQLLPGQRLWERQTLPELDKMAKIHVLEVADFSSLGGANHRVLKDRSVLLVDDAPDQDTYVVTVRTHLTGISGFKLETLTDASLPGNGPGRSDESRPAFVLTSFHLSAAAAGSQAPAEPVALRQAQADFSQEGYDIAGALDDDPRSGWAIAPAYRQDHWAVFWTASPVGHPQGMTLTFRLVQNAGEARTIGRFRLSAVTGGRGAPDERIFPAEVAEILKTPEENRSAKQAKRLAEFYLSQDQAMRRLQSERAKVERALKDLTLPRTLVMQELEEARPTARLIRGNFLQRAEIVQPGAPSALHPLPAGPLNRPNRLTLARWLVDRENPLVARVTVNRWWAEIFGRGLVATPEDFGIKGELPTHPELLDWLAVEFMERGWSMKAMLKLMVTSATYRQSSRLTPELRARDDQNKLYARGPRFRLAAEMIRDNALAAAGLLNLKPGGPPVRPYQPPGLWENKVGGDRASYEVSKGQEQYRRGVYVVWKRASPYPSFVNFDATARTACVVHRSRSNTPLQALTLLNDPVYVEAAGALARRTLTERAGASVEERIEYAFRLCLSRRPQADEMGALKKLFDLQYRKYVNDPEAAKSLIGSLPLPQGVGVAELAAWQTVASALLNLDEMITKG